MKKLVAALTLSALMVTSGYVGLIAQGKKSGEKSSSSKSGTIELVESKDGKYRITIRNGEGKYLAGSPVGHETEKEAREVAEELRSVIANAKFVSKKADKDK